MADGFVEVPRARTVTLTGGVAPACLVDDPAADARVDADGLSAVDIRVEAGRIAAIAPRGGLRASDGPRIDLKGGMIWPGFVDMHTHIDKGHIWPRAANPDGSFDGALNTVMADRDAHWSAGDVRARMAFSLACAHAHGTVAVRTHLDSTSPQHRISWPVFKEVRDDWAGRVALQACSLFGIDLALEEAFLDELADLVAACGGILGCVAFPIRDLDMALDRVFRAAEARGLALDFHADETLDPASRTLRAIAAAKLRHGFEGTVVAGHCCSLSTQSRREVGETLDLVAEAGIAVVSLPMCNLYLQDRGRDRTPRHRGITLVHELKARGIRVAVASDNTRDPFYAYGDMDMLEVFAQAVRIGQLDHPIGDWPDAVARTPADIMGMPGAGRIEAGGAADLVLCNGRSWTELLARPQADRVVLRAGQAVDTTPPDYRELDALFDERMAS